MGSFTEKRLIEFGEAWDRADIDALMAFVDDDCVFSSSAGPDPGETFTGRDAVRRGFLKMLAHDAAGVTTSGRVWICGDRGVAEWSSEFTDGERTRTVRGCDLFEFRGDRILRKDAFRKTF